MFEHAPLKSFIKTHAAITKSRPKYEFLLSFFKHQLEQQSSSLEIRNLIQGFAKDNARRRSARSQSNLFLLCFTQVPKNHFHVFQFLQSYTEFSS